MVKKPARTTSLDEIENTILSEAITFYGSFAKRHPKATIYAFLFELSAVGYAVAAAIATEESLTRYAEECEDEFDGDLVRAKQELRWGGIEDGWYQSKDKDFRNSNKLLDLAEEQELYPEYDGTLEKVALAVIQSMVSQEVFGPKEKLESLVVGICHTGGDNSDKDFIKWASSVNSPAVIKRLKSELKHRS